MAHTPATAALRGYPSVPFVRMDHKDASRLYAKIVWHDDSVSCVASTNHGGAFFEIAEAEIPGSATDQLWQGEHRYARLGRAPTTNPAYDRRTTLLYSADAGLTWTETALASCIGTGTRRILERDRSTFQTEYGHRLPARSPRWTVVFFLTSLTLLGVFLRAVRHQVGMGLLVSMAATMVILVVMYVFLRHYHTAIQDLIAWQFDEGYWIQNIPRAPTRKAGLLMALAAGPLWISVFLMAVFPFTPLGVHAAMIRLRKPGGRFPKWPAVLAALVWTALLTGVRYLEDYL